MRSTCGIAILLLAAAAATAAGPGIAPQRSAAADTSPYRVLDRLRDPDVPIVADFHETSLPMLLRAVGRAGGLTVDTSEGCSAVFVSIDAPRRPLKRLLADLALQYDLVFAVPAPDRLEVACGGHARDAH